MYIVDKIKRAAHADVNVVFGPEHGKLLPQQLNYSWW